MTDLADFPVWAALLVGGLAIAGALVTLVGALGLVRFRTFFQRIHAPTLGTSLGCAFVLLASALYFSILGQRLVLHEALIFIFVTITTPVTLMLLSRATLYRDRLEAAELERAIEAASAEPDGAADNPRLP